MATSDRLNITIIAARGIEAYEPLYCSFEWAAQRYSTDTKGLTNKEHVWENNFMIHVHPAMEKILRFEVRDMGSDQCYGKVRIDAGKLMAGPSEGWYKLYKEADPEATSGELCIRLVKEIEEVTPVTNMNVLRTLDDSVNNHTLEAQYAAGLTKQARTLSYHEQRDLRPVFRLDANDSLDSDDDAPKPMGKDLPVFWELKNLNPGLDDKKIHSAMAKNGNDLEKTMDYLQKKQHKAAREVQKHEFLDGGKLDAPPVVPQQPSQQPRNRTQEKKNIELTMNAAADEMMDVPLFEDIPDASINNKRHKALLIGCNYTDLGQNWQLNGGPHRDIRRVRKWLLNVCNFATDDRNMMMMADDHPEELCKPTRSRILRALQWLAKDAACGDSLFLYFSGHGGTRPGSSRNVKKSSFRAAFPDQCPFWTGIDGQKVDVAEIYEHCLIELPEGCRITFLVDCPEFHLWQPWIYRPDAMKYWKHLYCYFLPADIQVFSSIGLPIGPNGGAFTDVVLTLLSQDQPKSSYNEFLCSIDEELKKHDSDQEHDRNVFTCSQRLDLNRPFDLVSCVPNCNRTIGPHFETPLNDRRTVESSIELEASTESRLPLFNQATDHEQATNLTASNAELFGFDRPAKKADSKSSTVRAEKKDRTISKARSIKSTKEASKEEKKDRTISRARSIGKTSKEEKKDRTISKARSIGKSSTVRDVTKSVQIALS